MKQLRLETVHKDKAYEMREGNRREGVKDKMKKNPTTLNIRLHTVHFIQLSVEGPVRCACHQTNPLKRL